jgi:hypothetical protein
MAEERPPAPTQSERLQILATEHWSLLATRSLIYQESLGRVNMFLAILSGAVIALALIAQADHFGTAFIAIAIFMLTVVFFTGVTTVRRLNMLNRDDYHMVIGMNRLRHGYFDLHPEMEQYFITSPNDDLTGALRTMGLDPASVPAIGSVFHGFVTLPGMLGVIVSAVAGAIAGLAAVGFGAAYLVVLIAGALGFAASIATVFFTGRRSFSSYGPAYESRFPSAK